MSDARNEPVVHERIVTTRSGPVAYLESEPPSRPGSDSSELPVAVFVHGIGTSSALWRKGMQRLGDVRRCIALDLPLHGRTPAEPDLEFSLHAMADVIRDFCDALEPQRVRSRGQRHRRRYRAGVRGAGEAADPQLRAHQLRHPKQPASEGVSPDGVDGQDRSPCTRQSMGDS